MKKILFVFGTRPEAIKLAPLIHEAKKHPESIDLKVCVTGQHREMLDQVLSFFTIKPDYDLNLMKENQTLYDITANGLLKLRNVFNDFGPDLVIVQGDTTTAFIGALAGYYHRVKVAHVEAGLRSGDKYSPYPEEMNRIMAGHIADYHFAPTEQARKNLENEGITKNIWVVGNTVIDALLLGLKIINDQGYGQYKEYFNYLDFSKKLILVTGHRRESFGKPFENICYAIKHLVESHDDIEVIYPVHMNPNVQKVVHSTLGDTKRIHLIRPLSYPYFIWLMKQSYIILTDSGGVQEEAPTLGKPVIVMREVTERTEGVDAGTAILVGTDRNTIFLKTDQLIRDQEIYNKMSRAANPYGDGKASERIIEKISSCA